MRVMVIWLVLGLVNPLLALDQDTLPLGPAQYRFSLAQVGSGQIYARASGKVVGLDKIVAQAADTDVFLIGEFHDNYPCHVLQRDLIAALARKYQIVVGFEFFRRSDNPWLEKWRQGQIKEDELLAKTAWYTRGAQNYGYTRVVMQVIRQQHIKVIGLNVDRKLIHKVSRRGWQSLTPAEQELFPTIKAVCPAHVYYIRTIFGAPAVQIPRWFNNIYMAQKCWDVIMAESMRRALASKPLQGFKGVIIAGRAHVAYGLGIVFRYHQANPTTRLTTIVPVMLPRIKKKKKKEMHPMMQRLGKLQPSAIFTRGIADYVFAVPKPTRSHFPVLGIRGRFNRQGRLVITHVAKKSLAAKNGLHKGDILLKLDGITIKNKTQLNQIIASKSWGTTLNITVAKKIKFSK